MVFHNQEITYVTKLKKNAKHRQLSENDLPDNTDDAILIDEVVEFNFGDRKELKHRSRRIACWSEKSRRVAMIANLLVSIIKRSVRRVCSFTGIVSLLRLQQMSYISLFDLLEKQPEWLFCLEFVLR